MLTLAWYWVVLIILGTLACPIFTLGCVLIAVGHPGLGTFAILISLLEWFKK